MILNFSVIQVETCSETQDKPTKITKESIKFDKPFKGKEVALCNVNINGERALNRVFIRYDKAEETISKKLHKKDLGKIEVEIIKYSYYNNLL